MTLAVVVVKDRRRPLGVMKFAYADGVPDSGSAVVMDGQKTAVQTFSEEVDLGS